MTGGAPSNTRRKGTALLAVMVVITIAALAGTSAIYMSGAQGDAARASVKRTQARAMAWSGVQAVMAELAEQREALLDGTPPRVTKEWTLYEDKGSRLRGQVRVLAAERPEDAVGAGGSEWPGGGEAQLLVSEQGKLDVNTATPEMLTALGLFDDKTVGAIVAARGSRPFSSVEDLLRVDGVTSEQLFGGAAAAREDGGAGGRPKNGPEAHTTDSATEPKTEVRAAGTIRGIDVLTVFSFDPNIQAGLADGGNAAEFRGRLRINLNTPWSDRLGRAVDERFGEGAGDGVKNVMSAGTKFEKCGDVAHTLNGIGLPPETWPPIFDAFTTTNDPYVPGRVDLNAAPEEVLACVPGFDLTMAKAIVEARGRLDEDQRRTPVWPVTQGIVTKEQFEKAADWVTTRSMQWRVRVEAGFVRGREGETERRGDEEGRQAGGQYHSDLEQRIVLEAVIDVSSERARVAYLRDVTMLDAARAMYARWRSEAGRERSAGPDEAAETVEVQPPRIEEPVEEAAPMPEPSHEMHFGWETPMGDEGGKEAVKAAPEPAPAEPLPGVDRRLGRWTTGKGGGR